MSRKFSSKSGFRTKAEAEKEGIKAYNEYMNTGHDFTPSDMSYSDLLDYWFEKHCYINLKYHTIEAYSNIVKNHLIVNFPITESVVKFYKEKVSYPFSKKYPHETEEDYLLRITSLALYFKASGRKHFYFDLSAAAPEVQKIVRWTIESDERFIDYDPLMYKWVQNQNSELRNLLKSKASSFKPNDIDLKAILKS